LSMFEASALTVNPENVLQSLGPLLQIVPQGSTGRGRGLARLIENLEAPSAHTRIPTLIVRKTIPDDSRSVTRIDRSNIAGDRTTEIRISVDRETLTRTFATMIEEKEKVRGRRDNEPEAAHLDRPDRSPTMAMGRKEKEVNDQTAAAGLIIVVKGIERATAGFQTNSQ